METDKNIQNDIDWKIIDQLHNATNIFSSKSLEIKKLFIAVVGISTPIIFGISEKVCWALFISLYAYILLFWIFDAQTYYYQVKLRTKMDKRFEALKNRNSDGDKTRSFEKDEFTIENYRSTDCKIEQVFKALFNPSLIIFYGIIFLAVFFFNFIWLACR